MKPTFLGIQRDPKFSPSHIENDREIFRLTGEVLRERGFVVAESIEVDSQPIEASAVFTMARGVTTLSHLAAHERQGKLIVNSPAGILNCYRFNMVSLLPQAGIPFPRSVMVQTADGLAFPGFLRDAEHVWVKRGDVHAVLKVKDVSQVHSLGEIGTVFQDFRARQIDNAVLQEHIEGQTVKFYAIRGGSFFRWYYQVQDVEVSVNADRLFDLAERAAAALNIDIYGGDAIVTSSGDVVIVDMNDWPTFARFRGEASRAIADHLIERIQSIRKTPRSQRWQSIPVL